MENKIPIEALDLMNKINEALAYLGFEHRERTSLFMVLQKEPKRVIEIPEVLEKHLRPGISREQLRAEVLKHFSIPVTPSPGHPKGGI